MQSPEVKSRYSPHPNKPGWRKYTRVYPRSLIARPANNSTAFGNLLHWLVPWNRHDYPGKGRAAQELFGPVTIAAIRYWCRGDRDPPLWACELLLAAAEARIKAGEAILRDLEAARDAVKAKRGGVRGLQRIDPETGLDGRNRTGRAGKRTELEL